MDRVRSNRPPDTRHGAGYFHILVAGISADAVIKGGGDVSIAGAGFGDWPGMRVGFRTVTGTGTDGRRDDVTRRRFAAIVAAVALSR